ncbi:MAG: pitrilysin family protein, partial [Candidatus Cloacimonadaceae bacterium]|nr:pitrilysin family protein [Candidatus Cloacimonadaceae bacterium]
QFEHGLKYHIKVNKIPENRVAFRLLVRAGSVLEDEDQRGLAHFAEHMLFNGGKNFTRDELIQYLNSIGMGYAAGLNAFTSYDQTVYKLSSPTDDPLKLRNAFKILADWAHQASFTEDYLEKERKIILEEYRRGQGWGERVYDKLYKVLLKDSQFTERSPIGTHEVLTTFKRDAIVRFYNDWYRPDLQEIVIVGDINPEQMIGFLKEYLEVIPKKTNPRPKPKFPIPVQNIPMAAVTTDSEAPLTMVNVFIKNDRLEYQTIQDLYIDMAIELCNTMLNSRFEELAKQPDAPFSMAYSRYSNLFSDKSTIKLMGISSEKKINATTIALLSELQRVIQHGFTMGELDLAINQVLREAETKNLEKDRQPSEEYINNLTSYLFQNYQIVDPEVELMFKTNLVSQMPLEVLNMIFTQLISSEDLVINVIGPQKEGLIYPTETELLAIYHDVENQEFEAYVDDVVLEPFMAELPSPIKIKTEKIFPKTNIKLWTLPNGIKIYSKKTDFKQDEILFKAASPGGFAQYSPDDIVAAQLSGYIVSESGFGEFDGTR